MPTNMGSTPSQSTNFAFLASHDPVLVRLGTLAERYLADDAPTALTKLRQFGEVLAQRTAAYIGIFTTTQESAVDLIRRLDERGAFTPEVRQAFHGLRRTGNEATHQLRGDRGAALHQLRMAFALAVWFHKSFGKDPKFKVPAFVPPRDPTEDQRALEAEVARLREQAAAAHEVGEAARIQSADEALRRVQAEAEAQKFAEDRAVWQSLAEEAERKLLVETQRLGAELAKLQAATAAEPPKVVEAKVNLAQAAGQELDLSEADTRRIIDEQLRIRGWEADSANITFAKGIRPRKGWNVAIAEWPTKNGRADYVLFTGLTVIGVIEAKRKNKDVAASIEQSKRYSRGYVVQSDETLACAPGAEYTIPFLFSTNGRPFLQQLIDRSGIWFLDARRPQNLSHALVDWYTPEGLVAELEKDVDAAERELAATSRDGLPLRDYQRTAVQRVEEALAAGRREVLVAMATGTGKTRTCIGLVYRLLKSKRFRRVLFLVDRSALGEQTQDTLKDIPMEAHQRFTDIYEVKELTDIKPEPDTKMHVATIQGMMKRILTNDDPAQVPPVDAYDCIVVDECHRGYSLDREMGDTELTFRSEADYISKYRRVLDYFDAVKIGLTATPALHTTQIFGDPAYTYSYRQAVIDGTLVDHEPPVRIVTRLAEDGMTWKAGEELHVFNPATQKLDTIHLADELELELDDYNVRVQTENFNRVVCEALARRIDPADPGKTLIFCVSDAHCDMVVRLLKSALAQEHGGIEDDAVQKITGAADQPGKRLRRFRNEKFPMVAVTVDLLTTGVDVPKITNLVFLRRVRSRILYEQMMGRATRTCDEIGKQAFRIFDCVDLYAAIEPYSTMKPVVQNPAISFDTLFTELASVTDATARKLVFEQLVTKLQRTRRHLKGPARTAFEERTGMTPEDFVATLKKLTPEAASEWIKQHLYLSTLLDEAPGEKRKTIVSMHEDVLIREEHGYGAGRKPEDYLESFATFVRDNLNAIPALVVVTQRPRDLTRQQLRELQLALDEADFTETKLRVAWRDITNQDIAATIIGFIRAKALGAPLIPYGERVDRATRKILASRKWNDQQRKWLERIGKQLKTEVVVDRDVLDSGEFKAQGGYKLINNKLDGGLDGVLKELTDYIWSDAA